MHPKHPMQGGRLPDWASGYGVDEYGPFATFTVAEVSARMRWVPPGAFEMGEERSPHKVQLTQGYWMADTPVTQALWGAVMHDNPSRFQSPTRPVERVSWDDAQRFIDGLNRRVEGLEARLPTEAEWECACRAGTSTQTYAGDLEILGARNAPVLDAIAWYGGNSGVDFDLANGADSSGWPDKQYPHTRAGTRPVAQKAANALGLYDMLGNVWEWCADWDAEYDGAAVDPAGPKTGAGRVIRGGSWGFRAGGVRAAFRNRDEPGYRNGVDLGFRLSRGPAPRGRSPGGAQDPVRRGAADPEVSGGAAVPEADRRP